MTVCDGTSASVASKPRRPDRTPVGGEFGELVGLWRRGREIEAELREVRGRQDEAIAYLARPGSNLRLGAAYLERLQRRQRELRARLRAQRAEAWRPGGPLAH